jgi:hypothetical protein
MVSASVNCGARALAAEICVEYVESVSKRGWAVERKKNPVRTCMWRLPC